MAMTITEKILARAAGKDSVKAGELVNANIDMINVSRCDDAAGDFDVEGQRHRQGV